MIGVVALMTTSGTVRAALMVTLILAVIALSQVVVTGFAGQVSLAQLTFAGVSAFTLSRLGESLHIPFPWAPLLAALAAAVVCVVFGLPALRVRGLPLTVATLTLAVFLDAFWFQNKTPDDRALFASLTVAQHLRLASREDAGVQRILEYFPALTNRMKVAAGQLSGGEQQMLALGRALALKPRALLVDELSMGLAPAVAESILAVIRKIAMEKGIAVLLVEQHIASALAFADRATVLVRGRIVLNGDAADLARPGEVIEAAYLGANVGSDRS